MCRKDAKHPFARSVPRVHCDLRSQWTPCGRSRTEENKRLRFRQDAKQGYTERMRIIMIRTMTIEDYEEVHTLWLSIRGFGIRSIDDAREGVERFLKRNPDTSVVAVEDGKIVGSILCGHDGRRGCFYHVCVHESYRKRGIGKAMAVAAMEALRREHINKVSLIAFKKNEVGNSFWKGVGWTFREDLNYYDFTLNEENITAFIQ